MAGSAAGIIGWKALEPMRCVPAEPRGSLPGLPFHGAFTRGEPAQPMPSASPRGELMILTNGSS